MHAGGEAQASTPGDYGSPSGGPTSYAGAESALAWRQRSERDTGADVGPSAATPAHSPPDTPPTLLILAGMPGSGKSTFAHALVAASASPEWGDGRRWVRASQDDSRSGKRQEVEDEVREALQRGDNVVVDRVDFNASQRAHFVQLGLTSRPRARIACLVLTLSGPTLRARLEARTDHPTLADPERALAVLARMRREWEPPTAAEGFDRVLTLAESDTPPTWTPGAITAVLARLETSLPPLPRTHPQGYRRGYGVAFGRGAPAQNMGATYRGRGRGAPYAPYAPYSQHTQHAPYGGYNTSLHAAPPARGAAPTRASTRGWGPPRGHPRGAGTGTRYAPQPWTQSAPLRPPQLAFPNATDANRNT